MFIIDQQVPIIDSADGPQVRFFLQATNAVNLAAQTTSISVALRRYPPALGTLALAPPPNAEIDDADSAACLSAMNGALPHAAHSPANLVWNQNEKADHYETCIRHLRTGAVQCHLSVEAAVSRVEMAPGSHLVTLKGVSPAGREVTQQQLVVVDVTPPIPGQIEDIGPEWASTWGASDYATVTWTAGSDEETGVFGYEVALVQTLSDDLSRDNVQSLPDEMTAEEWLGGVQVARVNALPCDVGNTTLPVKLTQGMQYHWVLFTINGAGLRSSSTSEAFVVDQALIPYPPTAEITDANGTAPLKTVSNLTLNIAWSINLTNAALLDEFDYNTTDDANSTAKAPLAPVEHFTFKVFVRRNGTSSELLTDGAPVECLPYLGAPTFLAHPTTTACRFGSDSHACCADFLPDIEVLHDALLAPRLGSVATARHVRQLAALNASVAVLPTDEGVAFLHHAPTAGEGRIAPIQSWSTLTNCTGTSLDNVSLAAASGHWVFHACDGVVHLHNAALDEHLDPQTTRVADVQMMSSSSASAIVDLVVHEEYIAAWIASDLDGVSQVTIASISAGVVGAPALLADSTSTLPTQTKPARELCASCLASDGSVLAHGWFHSQTGGTSCDEGGGVAIYDLSTGWWSGKRWVRRATVLTDAPLAAGGVSGCSFGQVIKVSGSVLAVGIPEGSNGEGYVSVYDLSKDGALRACTLAGPLGVTAFGSSLSLRSESATCTSLAVGMHSSAADGNVSFSAVHQILTDADGNMVCSSSSTRSAAPGLRLSTTAVLLSERGVVAAVLRGALNKTSLSYTTYCSPGSIKVPMADHQDGYASTKHSYRSGYAYGCEPCPPGQTSAGGTSRICISCSGFQCIPSDQFSFQAYVNVQDVPNPPSNGDSLSVQVVAQRGAANSALSVANTSVVLFDSTPPNTGRVDDAMPCGCILPSLGFPTVAFSEGGQFTCDSRQVSFSEYFKIRSCVPLQQPNDRVFESRLWQSQWRPASGRCGQGGTMPRCQTA